MSTQMMYVSPTPKRLVLSLLSSPELQQVTARECAQWGRLFDIDPTAMRVALGRLVKSGFLHSVARGRYSIGVRGKVLSETARGWIVAEQRIGSWDGRWLLVHTAHLGRRDRTALSGRERALALVGFATAYPGLWCRPANLLESPTETRSRLMKLGLESEAVLIRGDTLLNGPRSFEELWPRNALESRYQTLTKAMQNSMHRGAAQDSSTLARETFLLGEAVIRQVNGDPLLPDSMIDANARRKMHETMVAYDAFGRDAWARFKNDFS